MPTPEVAGIAAQRSFFSCLYRAGMLALTVITQPACRPVMACAVSLCVQGAGRDDRPGQVTERLQQFPDGTDLIGLRVHGDLAEDRADTLRQGRDQVQGFLFPVPGAADGLAADRGGPRLPPSDPPGTSRQL